MIGLPIAHVAGMPIEETLAAFGPALLMVAAAAWAKLGARLRRLLGGNGRDNCSGGRDRARCETGA